MVSYRYAERLAVAGGAADKKVDFIVYFVFRKRHLVSTFSSPT
jgi:hypothetical protein